MLLEDEALMKLAERTLREAYEDNDDGMVVDQLEPLLEAVPKLLRRIEALRAAMTAMLDERQECNNNFHVLIINMMALVADAQAAKKMNK